MNQIKTITYWHINQRTKVSVHRQEEELKLFHDGFLPHLFIFII
jgi:hypothetical protein